eukprot:68800-Rhodomonas_salina.2
MRCPCPDQPRVRLPPGSRVAPSRARAPATSCSPRSPAPPPAPPGASAAKTRARALALALQHRPNLKQTTRSERAGWGQSITVGGGQAFSASCLRVRYAMPSADIAYGARARPEPQVAAGGQEER